jgi:hypothetical protein
MYLFGWFGHCVMYTTYQPINKEKPPGKEEISGPLCDGWRCRVGNSILSNLVLPVVPNSHLATKPTTVRDKNKNCAKAGDSAPMAVDGKSIRAAPGTASQWEAESRTWTKALGYLGDQAGHIIPHALDGSIFVANIWPQVPNSNIAKDVAGWRESRTPFPTHGRGAGL